MLVTITCSGINQACVENHIVILNLLAPGRILEYHCRSNDDDLGVRRLDFNATPFIIKFHDEIPHLTKWNCIFRQGPNMEYSFDVEVYKAGPRLIPRCGQLRVWAAKINGIYFARKYNTPLVRVLFWNE
ncbi:unnamed protein product [Arabidopsis lyrata]|uniref:S-protein homolog n=1 Tax=Arabidopsis lyrata subsp. lyrata TaxID=81972 RepID=D7MI65_ARALL|nr:hypothetical protein ARALYDRAFT_915812 [Arabidopsis lyrata subsp. lyrata]CAH8277217.1 unnamed protein product [Arabidopsis lyrata]